MTETPQQPDSEVSEHSVILCKKPLHDGFDFYKWWLKGSPDPDECVYAPEDSSLLDVLACLVANHQLRKAPTLRV